jgi:hypothetical protein
MRVTIRAPRVATENPAAVGAAVAVVGLGYTIFKDILGNAGDIGWNLGSMDGAKYPWDDKAGFHHRGVWRDRRFTVKRSVTNHLGDEISATFRVEYWYNGHAVGFVSIDPVASNDAVGWGLQVVSRITVDPNTYRTTAGSLYTAIFVRFNYRFDRSIGSDIIKNVTYRLRGTGTHTETA